jgi:hypothetical protein
MPTIDGILPKLASTIRADSAVSPGKPRISAPAGRLSKAGINGFWS